MESAVARAERPAERPASVGSGIRVVVLVLVAFVLVVLLVSTTKPPLTRIGDESFWLQLFG